MARCGFLKLLELSPRFVHWRNVAISSVKHSLRQGYRLVAARENPMQPLIGKALFFDIIVRSILQAEIIKFYKLKLTCTQEETTSSNASLVCRTPSDESNTSRTSVRLKQLYYSYCHSHAVENGYVHKNERPTCLSLIFFFASLFLRLQNT